MDAFFYIYVKKTYMKRSFIFDQFDVFLGLTVEMTDDFFTEVWLLEIFEESDAVVY